MHDLARPLLQPRFLVRRLGGRRSGCCGCSSFRRRVSHHLGCLLGLLLRCGLSVRITQHLLRTRLASILLGCCCDRCCSSCGVSGNGCCLASGGRCCCSSSRFLLLQLALLELLCKLASLCFLCFLFFVGDEFVLVSERLESSAPRLRGVGAVCFEHCLVDHLLLHRTDGCRQRTLDVLRLRWHCERTRKNEQRDGNLPVHGKLQPLRELAPILRLGEACGPHAAVLTRMLELVQI
mmetsp:Transcript_18515/g.58971  ORF Transcript_18515/g.58971 Transcript_18515/m.58971 type:complete len:236 (-) Transcript_18515:561-1268(-)